MCLQFYCNILTLRCPTFSGPDVPFDIPFWPFIQNILGLDPSQQWYYSGFLAIFIVGYVALACCTDLLISHIAR
jgi:hypothetical protein